MPRLEGARILVTGDQGFLGNAIATRLETLGARVVGTDRVLPEKRGRDGLQIDLAHRDQVQRLSDRGPYAAVVHCAAALPGEVPAADLLAANLSMTQHLMQWWGEARIPNLVFISGCNVYGRSTVACDETSLPAPADLYALSKLACEHLVRIAAASVASRACILRVSAPYGPRLGRETVIKLFITLAARREPITLLGSGSRTQDFVFEEDVAQACSLALTHDAEGTFNISGDGPVTMRELAETVLHVFDAHPETALQFGGVDPQERFRGHYPVAAATRAFGYRPQVELAEGIRRTAVAWGLL